MTASPAAAACTFPTSPPILGPPPDHRRARGILGLEPVSRAARAVARALPFGHDAFVAELEGMGEHGGPVLAQGAGLAAAPGPLPPRRCASCALRPSIGSARRSSPSIISKSKAHTKTGGVTPPPPRRESNE